MALSLQEETPTDFPEEFPTGPNMTDDEERKTLELLGSLGLLE